MPDRLAPAWPFPPFRHAAGGSQPPLRPAVPRRRAVRCQRPMLRRRAVAGGMRRWRVRHSCPVCPALLRLGFWFVPDAVKQYALPNIDRLSSTSTRSSAAATAWCRYCGSKDMTFTFLRGPFTYCRERHGPGLLRTSRRGGNCRLPGHVVELPGYFRLSLTATDEMVDRSFPVVGRVLERPASEHAELTHRAGEPDTPGRRADRRGIRARHAGRGRGSRRPRRALPAQRSRWSAGGSAGCPGGSAGRSRPGSVRCAGCARQAP